MIHKIYFYLNCVYYFLDYEKIKIKLLSYIMLIIPFYVHYFSYRADFVFRNSLYL